MTIAKDSLIATEVCKYLVQWCKDEKRSYLRYRVEIRLAILHLEQHKYAIALEGANNVMEEVRKADDKMMLVEIELVINCL